MTKRKRETFTLAETVTDWLEANATTGAGKEGEDVTNCLNSVPTGAAQARVDCQSSGRVAHDADEGNQAYVAQRVGTISTVGTGPSQSAAHDWGLH